MRNVHHQNNNHKRMRGGRNQHHNNRKNQNPLTRAYESNGPDVKIRGTAATIAEKYIQLARDAQSSGDPVAAENYYQHAEHYFRLIAAAQELLRQQNPAQYNQMQLNNSQSGDDAAGDDEEDFQQSASGQNEPYNREQPQPYLPRDAQPFPPREQSQGRYQRGNVAAQNQPQPQSQPQPQPGNVDRDIGALPSFITGSQPIQSAEPAAQPAAGQTAGAAEEPNGDRFPLHRRRRRHRGNRPEFTQATQSEAAEEQPGE
jgi:hypothetical protein